MIEVKGNLWSYWNHDHIICITTNGTLKKNGSGVMGRGCAAEATKKVPKIAEYLGKVITHFGNHVHHLVDKPLPIIVSFPVKHNWWERADLELIERSKKELLEFWKNGYTHKKVVIPRPGCGNGGRRWEEVKPILEDLPDDFLVISF
jgi:hypothetical protein